MSVVQAIAFSTPLNLKNPVSLRNRVFGETGFLACTSFVKINSIETGNHHEYP